MSWLISSASSSSDWYSAAIQTSPASSMIFLPIWCAPLSRASTVPEPSGREVARSVSSANRESKFFTTGHYSMPPRSALQLVEPVEDRVGVDALEIVPVVQRFQG